MPHHPQTVDERADEKQMRACAREWISTYNGPLWSIGEGLTVEIRNHGGGKKRAVVRDRYTGLSARVIAPPGAAAYAQLGAAINLMANAQAGLSA